MMYKLLDICAYLEERGIPYDTEGKNLSMGWIGLQCFWCDDPSNHLGVNLDSKKFKCLRCHKKGVVTRIVQEVEGGCSIAQANTIIRDFLDPFALRDEEILSRHVQKKEFQLPYHEEPFLEPHREYLKDRGFDVDFIVRKYELMSVGPIGKYKLRIVIPIIMGRDIVGFTTRDITGLSDKRYWSCPDIEARIPARRWIYNVDTVKDTVLVLEGPTDVWRMGDGSVSLLGSEGTDHQMLSLIRKGVTKAFVLFDSGEEAQKQGSRVANNLSALIPAVEMLTLDSGDPAELSPSEVMEIRREIFSGT